MLKTCSRCKVEKTLEEFFKQKKGSQGRHNQCRECARQSNREYYRRHPKKAKEKRDKRSSTLIYFAPLGYLYKDKLDKFLEQYPVCEICAEPCKSRSRLSIDHSHETNEVRGFICLRCNMLLGYARDNTEILNNAAKYLVRAKDATFTSSLTSKLKAMRK